MPFRVQVFPALLLAYAHELLSVSVLALTPTHAADADAQHLSAPLPSLFLRLRRLTTRVF